MAGQHKPPANTGEYRVQEVFGATWRLWVWLKRQFTLTSALALLGALAGLGGWALALQTRVVVLETRMTPVLASSAELAALKQRVDDNEERLGDLEDAFRHAQEEAGPHPPRNK